MFKDKFRIFKFRSLKSLEVTDMSLEYDTGEVELRIQNFKFRL